MEPRADVSLPSSVKGERVDAPRHYRFYLKRNGHPFAAEVLECNGDREAMVKAKEFLTLSTAFHLMEVWQGTREVGVVTRGS